jgi:AraC family transcriptional regulator
VTALDPFVRFLDLIPEALDDPSISADELAGRAAFSRFHFDRLVAAAAGEPPGAFRRRLLLERAAYRLVAGGHKVLDVAVEAGYGSNEAFTRAFVRAYGVTPSAFRMSPPEQVQLTAPSGVHFVPPGGIRLPATRKVDGMDLVNRMVDHHVWLVGEIIDKAATLDSEVLDRPIDGQLDDTVVDTLCDPPQEYTYGGIIAHVLTFAAHRRMVAIGALHSAGVIDLGIGDPRLWVAENAA